MQSVVIKGQSTTKGVLPIKCDDDGNLIIQLEGATVNIGDVDVASIAAGTNLIGKVGIDQVTANANEIVVKSIAAGPLPDTLASDLSHIHAKTDNLNVGDQAKAASISVTPATDIPDGRYIGDVKFGESAPLDVSYSTGVTDAKTIRVKLSTEDLTALENINIDSSALPTGAATHVGQDEQSAKLDSIIAALGQLAALQDKVIGEVVNETPNGTNDTFTVDYAFVANTEFVVVNQLVKTRGASFDYVPTGTSKQIVFNAGCIPPLDATINVSYLKA